MADFYAARAGTNAGAPLDGFLTAVHSMSGARITGTAALELSLTGKQRALATMCIGVGQGIALALERA